MKKLKFILQKFNYVLIFLAAALIIMFYVTACIKNTQPTQTSKETNFPNVDSVEDIADSDFLEIIAESEFVPEGIQELSPCRISILDVGQASCAIVESNGEVLVFDGGDKDTASKVVSYFKAHGITRIKFMVASHYHADHIYGLLGLIKTTDVNTIICPDYVSSTNCYTKFLEYTEGYDIVYPYVGECFQIGDIQARVITPVTDDYSDDNGYSIGMIFTYGDFTFLIDGDATEEAEQDMLKENVELDADLLIVPHHGSQYSSSAKWLQAVSPDTCVISVGKNNTYYHPHEETLKRMKRAGVTYLYRTDLHGTVVITSDGTSYTIQTEKDCDINALWRPGVGENGNNTMWSDESIEPESYYVGNIISKRFHRPDCEQLPAEKNQEIINLREDALAAGYIPCTSCSP